MKNSKMNSINDSSSVIKQSNFYERKDRQHSKTKSVAVILCEKYLLKYVLNINPHLVNNRYRVYKGIDIVLKKYVIVYIKAHTKDKGLTKIIKEELREKISPPVCYIGTEKIQKKQFDVEVHQKYGPTIFEIMKIYRQKISEKTVYLMTYHLLKLADRIDNAGYSLRTISPKNIVLSQSPSKTELFLLNTFDLERKGEESLYAADPKYCSVGSHLKLKTCAKDMIESICYLLMDFYQGGRLFYGLQKTRDKDYIEAKSLLNPNFMPYHFVQFYNYAKNLNHSQEFKFSQWKIHFKKLLTQQELCQPYQWIKPEQQQSKKQQLFGGLFGKLPQIDENNQLLQKKTDTLKYKQTQNSVFQGITMPQQDNDGPLPLKEITNSYIEDKGELIDQLTDEDQGSKIIEKIRQFSFEVSFNKQKKY